MKADTHTTTLTHVQWQDAAHTELALECQGLREQICSARTDHGVHIFHAGRAWIFDCPAAHGQTEQAAGSGAVLAPLTARVLQGGWLAPGDAVVCAPAVGDMALGDATQSPSAG